MKKKLQLITILLAFTLPLFLQAFNYLGDEDFKRLSGNERTSYLNALENAMSSYQQRKTDALEESERVREAIAALKLQLEDVDAEIAVMLDRLGITEENFAELRTRILHYQDQLTNWERMNDDELWTRARDFAQLREDYNRARQHRLARLPEFQRDLNDLQRRFIAIEESLDRARRTRGYWEENYTVKRGDTWLSIAGHCPIREGVIRRANRDVRRIHNNPGSFHSGHLPNLREGLNVVIPHGEPTQWRVFRGESLWRIASYPEVYGSGLQWTRIHRANRDQIRDPNLIFPNQVFIIPRDN
jgi:nucleoid-associated protein YgaU